PTCRDAWSDHIDRTTIATPLGIKLNPTALFQTGHALHDLIGDARPTDHRTAIVIKFDQITVGDTVFLGIFNADQNVLAALNVLLKANLGVGHLRVQTIEGVWTDHVHLALLGVTQIFSRFQEFRDRRAIGDVVTLEGFTIQLDLPGSRMQGVLLRVVVEIAMAHPLTHFLGHTKFDINLFPELFKRHIGFGMRVSIAQDLINRKPFSELEAYSHQITQPLEDLEIIQALAGRFVNLAHGIDLVVAVGAAGTDIVA